MKGGKSTKCKRDTDQRESSQMLFAWEVVLLVNWTRTDMHRYMKSKNTFQKPSKAWERSSLRFKALDPSP